MKRGIGETAKRGKNSLGAWEHGRGGEKSMHINFSKRSKLPHLVDHAHRPSRVRQMQGQNPEETGLSAIAVRKALATAEGVYDDIRRGFQRGDNAADGVLLTTEP